jgi:hypothetical protein
LIGKWHTSGKLLIGEGNSSTIIRGMDTYEWIAAGNFILHTVDVFMGNDRTQVTEIIGVNKRGGKFLMTSYDSTGAVTSMTASLTKSGVLKLGDKKMRAVLSRNNDGSMTADWELFDKTWKPWMEIQLTK